MLKISNSPNLIGSEPPSNGAAKVPLSEASHPRYPYEVDGLLSPFQMFRFSVRLLPNLPIDKFLDVELGRRSLHLNALQLVVNRHYGLEAPSVTKRIREVTNYRGKIYLTDPVLVELSNTPAVFSFADIRGLKFDFSFHNEASESGNNNQVAETAAIKLSEDVVRVLRKDSRSHNGPRSILKTIRDFFALAGHDFIHSAQPIIVGPDIELQAVHLQHHIWETIKEKNPNVVDAISRRGERFLEDILSLHGRMIDHGETPEKAHSVAEYLAIIGLSQLDIMLDLTSECCKGIRDKIKNFELLIPPSSSDTHQRTSSSSDDNSRMIDFIRNQFGMASVHVPKYANCDLGEALDGIFSLSLAK